MSKTLHITNLKQHLDSSKKDHIATLVRLMNDGTEENLWVRGSKEHREILLKLAEMYGYNVERIEEDPPVKGDCCYPPGTKVLVNCGGTVLQVPIEEVQPNVDQVLSTSGEWRNLEVGKPVDYQYFTLPDDKAVKLSVRKMVLVVTSGSKSSYILPADLRLFINALERGEVSVRVFDNSKGDIIPLVKHLSAAFGYKVFAEV